jgi:hypothetical protein
MDQRLNGSVFAIFGKPALTVAMSRLRSMKSELWRSNDIMTVDTSLIFSLEMGHGRTPNYFFKTWSELVSLVSSHPPNICAFGYPLCFFRSTFSFLSILLYVSLSLGAWRLQQEP